MMPTGRKRPVVQFKSRSNSRFCSFRPGRHPLGVGRTGRPDGHTVEISLTPWALFHAIPQRALTMADTTTRNVRPRWAGEENPNKGEGVLQ
jgi:hypothetical protein